MASISSEDLDRLRELVREREGPGSIELFEDHGWIAFLFRAEGWKPYKSQKFYVCREGDGPEPLVDYLPAL